VRKAVLVGLLAGCVMCGVLWPIMYMTAIRPSTRWTGFVQDAGLLLWPTSIWLMAVQFDTPMLSRVWVSGLAVVGNGLLYAMVAALGCLVVRSFGARGRGDRVYDGPFAPRRRAHYTHA
jgi:hypothetical protein